MRKESEWGKKGTNFFFRIQQLLMHMKLRNREKNHCFCSVPLFFPFFFGFEKQQQQQQQQERGERK